jgi:hypothetical protein
MSVLEKIYQNWSIERSEDTRTTPQYTGLDETYSTYVFLL